MSIITETVRERVGRLVDPETGMTFEEMRLVQEIREVAPGVIEVTFRPSSPICPIALKLAMDIKNTVLEIEGVQKARVHCVGHRMQETIDVVVNTEEQERSASFKGIQGDISIHSEVR